MNLQKHIEEMRGFGDFLMPYNYPRGSAEDEDIVGHLKMREVLVDGYHLILHYSKSDYGTHFLETLQVLGKYAPFLPFYVICKIGKKFLGEQHLSLLEFMRGSHKIYCWTLILDEHGKAVSGPYDEKVISKKVYEGLEYVSLSSAQVDFH